MQFRHAWPESALQCFTYVQSIKHEKLKSLKTLKQNRHVMQPDTNTDNYRFDETVNNNITIYPSLQLMKACVTLII